MVKADFRVSRRVINFQDMKVTVNHNRRIWKAHFIWSWCTPIAHYKSYKSFSCCCNSFLKEVYNEKYFESFFSRKFKLCKIPQEFFLTGKTLLPFRQTRWGEMKGALPGIWVCFKFEGNMTAFKQGIFAPIVFE